MKHTQELAPGFLIINAVMFVQTSINKDDIAKIQYGFSEVIDLEIIFFHAQNLVNTNFNTAVISFSLFISAILIQDLRFNTTNSVSVIVPLNTEEYVASTLQKKAGYCICHRDYPANVYKCRRLYQDQSLWERFVKSGNIAHIGYRENS